MDLLTGAMGILAPKLLDLLQHEYNLQTGLSNEVRSLSQELEHIDAFLCKVADVPWDQLDEQVKVWAREVREASYDMEDAIDIFLVHVENLEPEDQSMLKRALKMIQSLFVKGKPRHDIAVVIRGIRKKLQEVAERRARYKIDDRLAKPVTPTSAIDPRLAAMYHEVGQIIGIDESRGLVISMLSYQRENGLPDDKRMKNVSIVGVGGLGKTTLAKAVYEKLKGDFECGAFVPVGRNPDLKRVFKDILLDLDWKKYKDLNMTVLDERRLIDEIRRFLKEKRYFIVIDDIWDLQSWGIIKWALAESNRGSRIITTTRNLEVAKEAGKVYELPPLSDDHSKMLFYTRIFGGEGKCLGAQSDEVSDKILKKCGGIPLAIITMASLLVGKPREVWSDLCKDIGFRHKDTMGVENTMRILSFSYYDLPSHLRTCLLYLSAFPEDYFIEKDPLIWKWIAEGFVHKKQENGLFELGEQYFNDLINRSMIQAVESVYGTIDGCRVHDMVLDLICSLSCHENSVTILDNTNVEGILSQNNKVRRLACQKSDLEHLTPQAGQMDMSVIRSYIACMCHFDRWVPLLSFKLVRVLAIEGCKFKEGCHIENLGNLLHLRYLSIRKSNVFKLPEQIGNMKFLQTLDLCLTEIEELPASIVKLKQLVCLSCALWIEKVPDWIGKLTSLEQLEILVTTTHNYNKYDDEEFVRVFAKELGSLTELRVLDIKFIAMHESAQRYFVESLRNLSRIQKIRLYIDDVVSWVDADVALWEATGSVLPRHLCHLYLQTFEFPRLPSWINRLHHLTYLSLVVATMDEQDIMLLGGLTELCYLSLSGTGTTTTLSKINAGDGFFQKLRWLETVGAMVVIQHEEDSTFSFHIWNGKDPMPFRSTRAARNNCCNVPSAVMPNLQVLSIRVFVRALKDGKGDCGNIGLEYLTSLQKLDGFLECQGASAIQEEEAKAELRRAISNHPNCPTFAMCTSDSSAYRLHRDISNHPNGPTFAMSRSESSVNLVSQVHESKDYSLPIVVEEDHGKDKENEEEDVADNKNVNDEHQDNEESENDEKDEEGTLMRKRRKTED
ncbi:unnamed protein product [Urochloa humidicola]